MADNERPHMVVGIDLGMTCKSKEEHGLRICPGGTARTALYLIRLTLDVGQLSRGSLIHRWTAC